MSFDEKQSKLHPSNDITEELKENAIFDAPRAPLNHESSLSKRKHPRTTTTGADVSQKDNTISSQLLTSQNVSKQQARKKNQSKMESDEVIEESEVPSKTKGIFEEYQERWEKNNKRIFRYLITWIVGDNGKIEDQLKLMMNYLSIIFAIVVAICGFATTYYFHFTNKSNIADSITNQAQTILMNGLDQYYNSTEYMFSGYEFVLDYLNDVITSKLEINYKIYNFNEIRQFPYKGPKSLHQKGDTNRTGCTIFSSINIEFDNEISMTCLDWYEFNTATVPTVNDDIYQVNIPQAQLHSAMDILNYVLEPQLFDVFVTKIFAIYFGFEVRQATYYFPGLGLEGIPNTYGMHSSNWYSKTKALHLKQSDNNTYRVFSTPYYDSASKQRIITVSKVMTAPNVLDTAKRYQFGKGRMIGIANVDIKISEFQKLFDDIVIYDTGYLLITNIKGKLINEPALFIEQIGMTGKDYTDLSITQLISEANWLKIQNSTEKMLMNIETLRGLDIVVASIINTEHFYNGESVVILFVIPWAEVYGAINSQNTVNLHRLMISSFSSLSGFLVATILCTIYVKKKIVQMVSAISELNQNALKLSGNTTNNTDSSTHSKKEVMEKLHEIQQNSQSQTIRDLVKGFENQLKGISKLGKGGENILKNSRNGLKFDSAPFCGTQLPEYVDRLLVYIDEKRELLDTDDHHNHHQAEDLDAEQPNNEQNKRQHKHKSQPQPVAGSVHSHPQAVKTLLSHEKSQNNPQNKKENKNKQEEQQIYFLQQNPHSNDNSFEKKNKTNSPNMSMIPEKDISHNTSHNNSRTNRTNGQLLLLEDIDFNKSFSDNIKEVDQSQIEVDSSTNNVINGQQEQYSTNQNNNSLNYQNSRATMRTQNMDGYFDSQAEASFNQNAEMYSHQHSPLALQPAENNNLTPHGHPDNQPYLPRNYTLQDSEEQQESEEIM